MPFIDCTPAGRSAHGCELGFAIRSPGAGKNTSLQIIIAPRLIAKLKWMADARLRLQWDSNAKLARLVHVTSQLQRSTRLLKLAESGRGTWNIPCTGAVADAFGSKPRGITPLTIVDVSVTDGLTFSLPTLK